MALDIEAARRAGYTDEEIGAYLQAHHQEGAWRSFWNVVKGAVDPIVQTGAALLPDPSDPSGAKRGEKLLAVAGNVGTGLTQPTIDAARQVWIRGHQAGAKLAQGDIVGYLKKEAEVFGQIGRGTPIFGPLAGKITDQLAEGNIGGAAGTAAAGALFLYGPKDIATSPLGLKIAERAGSIKAFKKLAAESAEGLHAADPLILDLRQTLREARAKRQEQEVSYHQQRQQRMIRAQEAGKKAAEQTGSAQAKFQAEKGSLAEPLLKIEFESIAQKFDPAKREALFRMVDEAPNLRYYESIAARNGLQKLFGELGGAIPQASELALLNRVFGGGLVKDLLAKRPFWIKAKEMGWQSLNIPRAVMASFDLSAPLRQGAFFATRRQFYPALVEMIKSFRSAEAYKAVHENIRANRYYDRAMEIRDPRNRLALTEMGDIPRIREEAFAAPLAEKLPLLGRGIRASGRGFSAFRDKLSMDLFADLARKADAQGIPLGSIDAEIANFVNAGTGRGRLLKSLEGSAVALNAVLFSPRLMASRLTLMNPRYYVKASPFIRKQALYSLVTSVGAGLTMLQLAKLAGAQVGDDPRSADFGKIIIGDTRLDLWGGVQQYARTIGQLVTQQYVSSTTGKAEIVGAGYNARTMLDILARQIESKEAPVFSAIMLGLRGKDFAGKPIEWPKEIGNRFTPIVLGDLLDLAEQDPKLLPLGALAVLGAGLQTYSAEGEKLTLEQKKQNTEISLRIAEQERVKERRRKTAETLADSLMALPALEAREQLKALMKDSPETADAVKREVRDRRLGRTYQEKFLMDLDVESGARAKMIYDIVIKFQTNQEKNDYLQELVKKGVLTAETYKQLRALVAGGEK